MSGFWAWGLGLKFRGSGSGVDRVVSITAPPNDSRDLQLKKMFSVKSSNYKGGKRWGVRVFSVIPPPDDRRDRHAHCQAAPAPPEEGESGSHRALSGAIYLMWILSGCSGGGFLPGRGRHRYG